MSYPPNNLSSISDASPATPNAHSGDHTETRAAINSIVEMLGNDVSGSAATLQARLEAMEIVLKIDAAAPNSVPGYPPMSLDPRTDMSPATPGAHAADHTDERDAVNAIVSVLGVRPQADFTTLSERLAAIDLRIVGRA